MSKSRSQKLAAVVVVILLVAGVLRAVGDRYAERRDAILAACRSELKSAGLTAAAVKNKYPTPELALCRCARVVPGGVGEVVVRGTFRQGTKFLFSSDKVQVVKEALVASPGQKESEYHVTIKAAQVSLPEFISLESFEPQLCRGISCPAVYIGGKYEWNFTANNGWKIQLRQVSEPGCSQGGSAAVYHAEFFHANEPKAFEASDVRVSCHQDGCNGEFEEGRGATAQQQKMLTAMQNVSPDEQKRSEQRVKELQAQMAEEQNKMQNFASLSAAEQKKIMDRLQEIGKQMAEALTPKGVAEAQKAMEQNKAEFGCHNINFALKGNALEGNMSCGEKVGNHGQLKLQGTSKFVG
ncbi:MAG: hypothetical protein ABSB82_13885 [Terriglobia bacterium]|jgi:hypothetical protein